MRISTILKIVGVLVIAVVVAIVAIVLTVDPNDYKDDIQQAAKDATGRDLTIEGDIGLELGLTVGLTIDGVRFANAAWGSEPDMLRAKEVAVRVAILPLISGNLDVKGLTIRDADILLETDAQGRNNADFSEPGATAAGGDAGGSGAGASDVSIAIDNVVIENATVTVRNAADKSETVLVVNTFNASGSGADSPLDIALAAELTMNGNRLPLEVEGTVGAPATLMAGNRPFPVDVAGKALGFEFKAKGAVNEPKTMSGIALALEASANDLSGLKPFAGDALPSASPFSFKGNVTGGGKKFTIDGLALRLGSTEVGGTLTADLSGARPRLDGTITAPRIDLTELIPAEQAGTGGGSSGGGPAPAGGGSGSARPGKVFPNDPLPLEGLRAADANLDVAVAELIAPGAKLNDLTAKIALDNGNLAIEPFGFLLSGSRFDGTVTLAARNAPAKLGVKLLAPKVDMGPMLKEQADIEMLRGDAAIDIDVAGSGDSVAAIMAGLNGHSRFLMNEGQAKTESFDLIVGGLSSVMSSLFSSKQEWVVLNCMASDFAIENGIAKSRLTLFDTELLTITGEGQADLGQETLAFKVSPVPKTTTINVSVPIRIGGTFANPTFAPDELATVRKLGSILGLAVFPPAAIIGLTELGGSDNECVQIAQKGAEAPPQQDSGSTVDQIIKAPEKALEGVGEGIRNLFGR